MVKGAFTIPLRYARRNATAIRRVEFWLTVCVRHHRMAPSFRGAQRTRNLEIPGLVLRTIPE